MSSVGNAYHPLMLVEEPKLGLSGDLNSLVCANRHIGCGARLVARTRDALLYAGDNDDRRESLEDQAEGS